MINAAVRGGQLALEEVRAPGQMSGAGFREAAGALLQHIGDGIRCKCLGGKGVLQSPRDGLVAVEVTPGNDLAHLMARVAAALCELQVIGLRPGRERQDAQKALLIPGFCPLRQEGFGGSGAATSP